MSDLSKSRFTMWRAVVAMMHADSVVKPHEINFVLEHIRSLPLNDAQRAVLMTDFKNPTLVDDLFHQISNAKDKEDFFHLARALAWADGDFDALEEDVLNRLSGLHIHSEDKTIVRRTSGDFRLYMESSAGGLAGHDQSMLKIIHQLIEQKP